MRPAKDVLQERPLSSATNTSGPMGRNYWRALELSHHEFNQLSLPIRRQQVEGMDGEANVSPAINDDDTADYVVKVLAVLI